MTASPPRPAASSAIEGRLGHRCREFGDNHLAVACPDISNEDLVGAGVKLTAAAATEATFMATQPKSTGTAAVATATPSAACPSSTTATTEPARRGSQATDEIRKSASNNTAEGYATAGDQ